MHYLYYKFNFMQKRKSTLSENDIKNMLKLEELFHSKFLTEELLNELTSLYVKAIDCINDKTILIKKYFLQKMQFVLSCPQIARLLQGNQIENLETENSLELYKIKISSMEYQYSSPTFAFQEKKIKEVSPKINLFGLSQQERTKALTSQIQIRFQQLTEYENNLKSVSNSFAKMNQKNKQVDYIVQSQVHIFDQNQPKCKRILRKKSADFIQIQSLKEELQIDLNPIKIEDLKRAKAQIQDKFSRFTFSVIQKNAKVGILSSNKPIQQHKKARIRQSRIQELEDDDWGFSKKQKQNDSENQNRSSRAQTLDQRPKRTSKFDLNTQQSLDEIIIEKKNSSPQVQNSFKANQRSKNQNFKNQNQSSSTSIQIQITETLAHDSELIEDDYF